MVLLLAPQNSKDSVSNMAEWIAQWKWSWKGTHLNTDGVILIYLFITVQYTNVIIITISSPL